MSKNAVTKAEVEKLPVQYHDYGADSGSGYENMSSTDMVIPWWNLLQGGSPAVKDNSPEGAREGMYLNSVTGELVARDVGVPVVPVYTEKAFVQWDPAKRVSGGGFKGVHDPNDPIVLEAIARNNDNRIGDLKTEDGMDLVETHYLYCLDLDEDAIGSDDEFEDPKGFSVFSFKKTGIRPFQTMMTATRMVKGKPPLWAFRTRIGSEKRQNDDGQFAVPKLWSVGDSYVSSLIPPSSPLFTAAKQFRQQVMDGIARVDYSKQEGFSASSSAGATRQDASKVSADEAPF